jgi:hypothetical protein
MAGGVQNRFRKVISMESFARWLRPLQQQMSARSAYICFLAALAFYFFALFLPWTSLPLVVIGHGDISANGWDEQAYLSVLPFAGVLLNGLRGRKAIKPEILGLLIMLAFAMLLVDNVEHRSVWLTPLLVDSGSPVPLAFYGSSLDIGFWFALAAMVCLSIFGFVWTMHASGEAATPETAPGIARQAA